MCLCVHILILGRDTISTESLDPKECVNRFGGALRKFEYIFSRRTFCASKNCQNRPFLKILKSILCACVCTYLFWGAWRSEQVLPMFATFWHGIVPEKPRRFQVSQKFANSILENKVSSLPSGGRKHED